MEVWKYEIGADVGAVSMPEGAKPLSVAMQGDAVCMWALLDPDQPLCDRHFAVYGTGWKMPDDPGRFIGTFQPNIGLVFHLFETSQ